MTTTSVRLLRRPVHRPDATGALHAPLPHLHRWYGVVPDAHRKHAARATPTPSKEL